MKITAIKTFVARFGNRPRALIKVETDLINQRRKMEGVHFTPVPPSPFGRLPTCLGSNVGWWEVTTTRIRSDWFLISVVTG